MAKRGEIAVVKQGDPLVTWIFADKTEITMDTNKLGDNVFRWLAHFGLKQKGSNAYAGADSVEEAKGLLQKTLDAMYAGKTAVAREVGESEAPTALLAKAIVAAYAAKGVEKVEADVVAYLDRIGSKNRALLRKTEDVAVQLAKLRAPKTAVGLDDLMALPAETVAA
jgi:hypothetical protein